MIKAHLDLRCKTAASLLAAAGALVSCPPLLAQDTDDVTIEVGRCVELTAPQERLACFEAQLGETLQRRDGGERDTAGTDGPETTRAAAEPAGEPGAPAAEPAAPAVEQTEPAAERVVTVRADGGNGGTSGQPRDEPEREPADIVGTIIALKQREPNQSLITLGNDQVWYQVRPDRHSLRVGDRVRLSPTGWGDSFRLTSDDLGRFIQVERVR